jgi:antitoxin CptB
MNRDAPIDAASFSKLKWRCRRGLLENDLFIERFFKRYEASLTHKQTEALLLLMDLSDNELLDLHLGRKSLEEMATLTGQPSLSDESVQKVLHMLRSN